LSPDEAETLLIAACEQGIATTTAKGLAWLTTELEAPLQDFLIAEQVEHLYIPTPRLTVGQSTYSLGLPRRLALRNLREIATTSGFNAPVVYVKVVARDIQTARILAAERIVESHAVLDLIDRPKLGSGRAFLARRADGGGNFSQSRRGWILDSQVVNEKGRLTPPYLQLARATGKAEARRSDWERRVLAATRWFSRASRSVSAADRLVGLMVALECIFVEGRRVRYKGDAIAKAITSRFRLRGMTGAEQEEWLRGLYGGRNDSVHEGREFERDLEVDRLADLTQVVIRSAAWHLVPSHQSSRRSCRTFRQAIRCKGW
jgi:hypothetical protein